MKKLALLLVVLLLAIPFFVKDQGPVEFCGVPVDGHVDTFVAKMAQMGYTEIGRDVRKVTMAGKFTGRDARMQIYYTPTTKTVYAVYPYFEKLTNWADLKSMYFEYKAMCIKQHRWYRVKSYELFNAPYKEGDGNEMRAGEEEECIYRTELHGRNAEIAVFITSDCDVTLGYINPKNDALNEAEING